MTEAGQRTFNVGVNGTPVLANYDILAEAGGRAKAVVEEVAATADGSGNIVLNFDAVNYYAQVNGIEVLSGSTVVQAINCGQLAGGTLTINPGVFTNQGTVAVSNGETLNVNASGSIGGFTVSGSGSRLTFNGTGYAIGQPLTIGAGTTLTSMACGRTPRPSPRPARL